MKQTFNEKRCLHQDCSLMWCLVNSACLKPKPHGVACLHYKSRHCLTSWCINHTRLIWCNHTIAVKRHGAFLNFIEYLCNWQLTNSSFKWGGWLFHMKFIHSLFRIGNFNVLYGFQIQELELVTPSPPLPVWGTWEGDLRRGRRGSYC